MRISFEGKTIQDIAKEAMSFFGSLTENAEEPVKSPPPTEKRSPGRPPKVDSKKFKAAAFKAPQVEKAESITDPFEMVGAAGIEPINITHPLPEPTAAKAVSKDDLTSLLQKLCEKDDETNKAGINKVREIYSKFGVKRLGELDPKLYHEMYALAEQSL